MDFSAIADEHASLLEGIARLDSAPSALRETKKRLQSLEKDLEGREDKHKKFVKKRKSEHKDLDELQRSGLKRFMTRVRHGGKEGLTKRLEKEEMEYIEAAQAEHLESQAINDLRAAIAEATGKIDELTAQVDQRKEWIRRLDELYHTAFTGPTAQFPEKDTAEINVRIAEEYYEEIQGALSREESLFAILNRAARCANLALTALERANRAATYDSLGVGGAWSEIAERDELFRAHTLVSEAERFLAQARQASADVPAVRGAEIVQPDWLNVVFDNLYTDIIFQQKIQKSIQSLTTFQQSIFTLCAESEARLTLLRQPAHDAQSHLVHTRRELHNVRRDILTQLAEERRARGGGESLPMYGAPAGMPLPRYESDGGAPSTSTAPPEPTPDVAGLARALSRTHVSSRGAPDEPSPGIPSFPSSPPPPVSPLMSPASRDASQQAQTQPVLSPLQTGSSAESGTRNASPPDAGTVPGSSTEHASALADVKYAPPSGPPPGHPALPDSNGAGPSTAQPPSPFTLPRSPVATPGFALPGPASRSNNPFSPNPFTPIGPARAESPADYFMHSPPTSSFAPGAFLSMPEPAFAPPSPGGGAGSPRAGSPRAGSPFLGSPRAGSPLLGSPRSGSPFAPPSPRAGSPFMPPSPRAGSPFALPSRSPDHSEHSRAASASAHTPPVPDSTATPESSVPPPAYAPPPSPPGHAGVSATIAAAEGEGIDGHTPLTPQADAQPTPLLHQDAREPEAHAASPPPLRPGESNALGHAEDANGASPNEAEAEAARVRLKSNNPFRVNSAV